MWWDKGEGADAEHKYPCSGKNFWMAATGGQTYPRIQDLKGFPWVAEQALLHEDFVQLASAGLSRLKFGIHWRPK